MNTSPHFQILFFVIVLLQSMACTSESTSTQKEISPKSEAIFSKSTIENTPTSIVEKETPPAEINFPKDRVEILKRLKQKIADQKPLVIHAFVPLCDNENQGIVPVNKSLGNGMNLRTNLYWGALYGVKTHFKNQKDWTLLFSQKDLNENVLERVVFYKKYANGAQVYFVADAYRGDRMKVCLEDYFDALSNQSKSDFEFLDKKIGIEGKADLIVFNGHNGLMDTEVDFPKYTHKEAKDAVTVACASFDYFEKYFKKVNAFPLLNTTNLLAPEAYVLQQVFDAWAMLKDEKAIHHAAGSAYDQYQNCGLRGAKRLFKSGW